MYEYKQTPDLDLELLESPTGENFVYGETQCKVHVFLLCNWQPTTGRESLQISSNNSTVSRYPVPIHRTVHTPLGHCESKYPAGWYPYIFPIIGALIVQKISHFPIIWQIPPPSYLTYSNPTPLLPLLSPVFWIRIRKILGLLDPDPATNKQNN